MSDEGFSISLYTQTQDWFKYFHVMIGFHFLRKFKKTTRLNGALIQLHN